MTRTPDANTSRTGTMFGVGSIVTICALVGVAMIAATAIVIVNRKKKENE